MLSDSYLNLAAINRILILYCAYAWGDVLGTPTQTLLVIKPCVPSVTVYWCQIINWNNWWQVRKITWYHCKFHYLLSYYYKILLIYFGWLWSDGDYNFIVMCIINISLVMLAIFPVDFINVVTRKIFISFLTHFPHVPQICISRLGQHWFR